MITLSRVLIAAHLLIELARVRSPIVETILSDKSIRIKRKKKTYTDGKRETKWRFKLKW